MAHPYVRALGHELARQEVVSKTLCSNDFLMMAYNGSDVNRVH
jgi:hypothetical protein